MFIDVGSASLFFDVVGESLNASTPDMSQRPTMILLHGGPGYDHSTLRPYFDRYSDTHQLVTWIIEVVGDQQVNRKPGIWIGGRMILLNFVDFGY
ncbi:MAG: hypothetical protein CM15mP54_28700 [Paracoccaceae bacterium]|nr:MAG: hypothetical protein CM15mP54_28700 [Paracoccaceae bacterium]